MTPKTVNEYRNILRGFISIAGTAAKAIKANKEIYADGAVAQFNRPHEATIANAAGKARENIDAVHSAAVERIRQKAQLDGNAVTNDIKLLNSTFNLTAAEIQALADKYSAANNQTMLRAIRNYADSEKLFIHVSDADAAIEAEEKFYKSAISILSNVTGNGSDVFNIVGAPNIQPTVSTDAIDYAARQLAGYCADEGMCAPLFDAAAAWED